MKSSLSTLIYKPRFISGLYSLLKPNWYIPMKRIFEQLCLNFISGCPEVFYKIHFLKSCKIRKKTPVPKTLFDKVAGFRPAAFRSSYSQMFLKIGVLKYFARKHLCWSFFLIKLQAWRCVLVNFTKILRTFLKEHLWTTVSKKILSCCGITVTWPQGGWLLGAVDPLPLLVLCSFQILQKLFY